MSIKLCANCHGANVTIEGTMYSSQLTTEYGFCHHCNQRVSLISANARTTPTLNLKELKGATPGEAVLRGITAIRATRKLIEGFIADFETEPEIEGLGEVFDLACQVHPHLAAEYRAKHSHAHAA